MYEHYDAFALDVLLDCCADFVKLEDNFNLLNAIKGYGLSVIESRPQFFHKADPSVLDLEDCFLGCVSQESRRLALRYAKAYLTFDKTRSTRVTQQRMSLEASASRLPVLFRGVLPQEDMRKGIVLEANDEADFQIELLRFQKDHLYRERKAHSAWRKVFQHHTFYNRLRAICKKIGLKHDFEEYPPISMIVASNQLNLLPKWFENFDGQTYPNKELIVVSSNNTPSLEDFWMREARENVQFLSLPEEIFEATALDYGLFRANGDYYFQVDINAHYGPNYVLDMILQAKCIDAELFGKPVEVCYAKNFEPIFLRHMMPPLSIASNARLSKAKSKIIQKPSAGRVELFRKTKIGGSAVSLQNFLTPLNGKFKEAKFFATMDGMNCIIERQSENQAGEQKEHGVGLKSRASIDSDLDHFFI